MLILVFHVSCFIFDSFRFPSVTPSRRPSARPRKVQSVSPSGQPTRIPSGFPTVSISPSFSSVPSIYEAPPSSAPSLSVEPTTQRASCMNSCDQQYSFCIFRTNQVCSDSACQGLCAAAVGSGELSSSFLEDCETNWCPWEVASCSSSSTVSCFGEKHACTSKC